MKRFLFVLSFVVAVTSASFAQALDFTLKNETGFRIASVYVSYSGSFSWGDNVLGAEYLDTGDDADILFDSEYEQSLAEDCIEQFELKAVYADGSSDEWSGLWLLDISELTISLDNRGKRIVKFE